MSSPDPTGFGYQIRPVRGGWAWVAYDLLGNVQARGWAPRKALAAACVVRTIARSAADPPVRSAA